MKKCKWFVADFETTSYIYYKEVGYTKVWLWAICDENADIVEYGEDIESFINWCRLNTKSKIYFHNLKFDGSFIIDYLLRNDYQYKSKLQVKDNKGFSTLIGEHGEFYNLTINFAKNKQVKIYDSLKIIPMKVKDIAKAFELQEQKEKIDYEDYTITKDKLRYIFHDVIIVAKALKFFIDKGFTYMTIGSNAYNACKDTIVNHDNIFPELDNDFLDSYRNAYRGGRCQVNPKYKNKILNKVYRYDINSMYPYQMAYKYLPYGEPIKINELGKYKFELYKINIAFKLKNGHMPTLLKTGSLFANEDSYYINTDGIITIYISNIDLELVYKHYDILFFELIDGYGFKTTNILFKEFITKYYDLKNNSTGGLKLLYKLILNSLYGKYGSRRLGRKKIPKIDEKGEVHYETQPEEEMKKYYLPLAIAITSYAHADLDNAISFVGDKFVYCDTDSVHTLVPIQKELIDNKAIGKFKLEAIEEISKYVRQKTYIYKERGKNGEEVYNITCAGMTDGLKEYLIDTYGEKSIEIFKEGLTIDLQTKGITREQVKLRPQYVKGGMVLVPTQFSIKEDKKKNEQNKNKYINIYG